MTGPAAGVDYGMAQVGNVRVTDSAHPMAAGNRGAITFSNSRYTSSWGVPGAEASIVAQIDCKTTVFAYDGDHTADGSLAPGCRLAFPIYEDGPTLFSTDAWEVLDATADSASRGCQG